MARQYLQGKFEPRNPEKYVGDVKNIQYRSSWELKLMVRLDTDPRFLKWASEEFIIPYISPVDNRPHRYFVDFIVQYKNRNGEVKKAAVEVKPDAQTRPPKQPKRVTKRFVESVQTYAVNEAKWKAATEWCKNQNMDFIILTEKELGITK